MTLPLMHNHKKIKLAYISASFGVKSDPLYWGPIFNALTESGYDVEVITSSILCKDSCKNISQNFTVNIKHRLGITFPNLLDLLKLKTVRCDVALVVEFNLISLFSVLYFSIFTKTKTIIMVENHPKYLSGYNTKRTGVFELIRKLQCKCAHHILTNNTETVEYVADILKVNSNKITSKPYLTSEIKNSNLSTYKDNQKMTFVTFGQLIERKGYKQLINEIATLSELDKKTIAVDIYGDGPQRKNLEDLVSNLNLNGIVNIKGKVPYLELGDKIKSADCFIISSLADYRSLSAFEAISLHMPLLISKYDGAINEVLIEGENGYSIDPLKLGDISMSIVRLLKNNSQIQRMGQKSAEIAKNNTVHAITKNHIFAIEKLIENHDK
jgi:glycosyltransferase involved in cell wall biosynthesis